MKNNKHKKKQIQQMYNDYNYNDDTLLLTLTLISSSL